MISRSIWLILSTPVYPPNWRREVCKCSENQSTYLPMTSEVPTPHYWHPLMGGIHLRIVDMVWKDSDNYTHHILQVSQTKVRYGSKLQALVKCGPDISNNSISNWLVYWYRKNASMADSGSSIRLKSMWDTLTWGSTRQTVCIWRVPHGV